MNKYLKVPTHNPNVCIRILQLNTANPFRRSVMAGPSLLQPPPCRGGVISVHHDPVHGIVTNPGNREWVPIVIFRGLCISHSWGHGGDPFPRLGIQKGNASLVPTIGSKCKNLIKNQYLSLIHISEPTRP